MSLNISKTYHTALMVDLQGISIFALFIKLLERLVKVWERPPSCTAKPVITLSFGAGIEGLRGLNLDQKSMWEDMCGSPSFCRFYMAAWQECWKSISTFSVMHVFAEHPEKPPKFSSPYFSVVTGSQEVWVREEEGEHNICDCSKCTFADQISYVSVEN